MSTITTTITTTKATETRKPRLEPLSLRYDPRDVVSMQEPTPEPSSPDVDIDYTRLPRPAYQRRFAPQLVDTSRRARRDGDMGSRPADKTDITPYTRGHKNSTLGPRYAKRRPLLAPSYKRESEDDFLLDLAARRAERKLRETALDVFPNSRANMGGDIAHFYFRDSDSDATTAAESDSGSPTPPSVRRVRRRRRSTDLGWWHGVMQQHAEQKLKEWQHAQQRPGAVDAVDGAFDVPLSESRRCDSSSAPIPSPSLRGENSSTNMDCDPATPNDAGVSIGCATTPLLSPKPRPALKLNIAGINAIEAEKPAVDPEFEVMRRAASPPLLGDDIVFPRCESPETVRLCTDLPFTLREEEEKTRRDVTQKCGLWRGFCFDKEGDKGAAAETVCAPAPLWGGGMLTPGSQSGAGCLWSGGKTAESAPPVVQTLSPPPTPVTGGLWLACASRARTPPRGLSPFQTNETPRTLAPPTPKITTEAIIDADPVSEAERERRIAEEFDDHLVTQVYNYLSLGYPVSARAFDEELCRATGMAESEITRRDADTLARGGHLCDVEVERCPAERQCPRWKALRAYIRLWAREQADPAGGAGAGERAAPRVLWGAGGAGGARVGGSWRA